ncbi:uncharacterized protein LOC111629680 [Centruroides sculpturatus]|uniref:uncharacterized protein LOC111629680 n=1 Tax=Centruroides sculpturatus TaxID=218467 RepID=UPI000C6D2FC3|nr:uncharacterized protein LOC111629680 [Centruroides sculpturatus]
MSKVKVEEIFNSDEVTLLKDNGESVVVLRERLIEKGGLLNNSIIVCPNERKFILKLPLTLEMLNEFSRYLEINVFNCPSVDKGFELYLISKRYFIRDLERMCLYYFVQSILPRNFCRVHDLACSHDEKQLKYRCWEYFTTSENDLFDTDDFKSCEETTMYKLLICSYFYGMDESDLVHGLLEWVEQKFRKLKRINDNISKGDLIRPFLPLIRLFIITPELIERLFTYITPDCISTKEVESIRNYQTHKNVATLPSVISAYSAQREIFDYYPIVVGNFRTTEELKRNTRMKVHFRFMADLWVPENCVICAFQLPIKHRNHKGVKVLMGVKSTYSQDFVYERHVCTMDGVVRFPKLKYLKRGSFHIFLVKIPKEEIKTTLIQVLKCSCRYQPIYDFRAQATRLLEKETTFNFAISLTF